MLAKLSEITLAEDLTLLGVLSVSNLNEKLFPATERLSQWQEQGFAGEMNYMNRATELFANLDNFLPKCRSIILLLSKYKGSAGSLELKEGYGRVASYAAGEDYHFWLREKIERVAKGIGLDNYRAFTDAVPLLERTLSCMTGNGFIAKNSMFILSISCFDERIIS